MAGLRDSALFLFGHPGFRKEPVRSLVRVVLWYLHIACGVAPRRRIAEWEACFELPRRWRTPAKVFYVFGRDYEEEVAFLEEYLRSGDAVIDVGANFGLYTLLAAAKVGSDGSVDAFEPFPESASLLERNVAANGLAVQRVRVHPIALGVAPGEAVLSVHDDPGRNSLGPLGSQEVGAVPVRIGTMDAALTGRSRKVDLIKIDVEGWELAVFRGGAALLASDRPAIMMEVNPDACLRAGATAQALVTFLKEGGYRFFRYAGNRSLREGEPSGFGNWIALPEAILEGERLSGWSVVRV